MPSHSSVQGGEPAVDLAAAVRAAKPDVGPARARTTNQFVEAMRDLTRSMFRFIIAGVAMVAALAAGIASSRMMIASGSALTTDSYGPWRHWRNAGRSDADPYTRAHFGTNGAMRMASHSAGVYEAYTDEVGARLHSSCDYVVEGPDPLGLWWSLTVFDSDGQLIANDAERYAFTRDTVALNPDGSYIVTLGRDARPGNWLPTGGAGRVALVFTVLDPATGLSDDQRAERSRLLPVIRREGCS